MSYMGAHTRLSISQSVNSKRLQTTAALKKIICKVMEKYKLLHMNIHSQKKKEIKKTHTNPNPRHMYNISY